jgi:hypothetical protein
VTNNVSIRTNPAEELWERQAIRATYPAGVLSVPEPIVGTAFFPGGYGLWNPSASRALPPFPVGGVMVLGHDFHSKAGYEASFKNRGESLKQPTWRNLLPLLKRSGIFPEECFFTNAFMGLRAEGTTGPFPGADDPEFRSYCQDLLQSQISVQRPSLIITLGVHSPPMLAELSLQLKPWLLKRGLKNLDKVGPIQTDVGFRGIAGFSTTVVALIHPSLRSASLKHREYKTIKGPKAEDLMLADAQAIRLLSTIPSKL